MATKQEVFEILVLLAAAYPRFQLVPETIETYAVLLQDLDQEELKAAAMDVATRKDFFPSVHEIRQAVVNIRKQANQVPSAYQAWSEVLAAGTGVKKSVIEVGPDKWAIEEEKFVFSHYLVEHVARALGWPSSFPGGDTEMADRAHFLKAYEQAVNDAMNQEITLPEVRAYIERTGSRQLGPGDQEQKNG